MKSLSFLHVVASVNPAVGGPAQSVPNLLRALASKKARPRLLCLDYPEHGPLPAMPPGVLTAVEPDLPTRLLRGWSPSLARAIDREASQSSVIHNHGLWMFPNHYAARAAIKHRMPYIVSPRGMLGSWALGNSALKKRVVWNLHEKEDLRSAAAFHATSESEAAEIRRAGFSQPIAVIPNGVVMPPDPAPERRDLEETLPQLKGKRLALFLSRIHPKKGPLELVRAWSELPPSTLQNWHLVIAGPDLSGYRSEVSQAISRSRYRDTISLLDEVGGILKESLLRHAELFVLPTREENFGIVIAEALAHGTPVLTTRAAPWEVLQTNNCGWWIKGEQETLNSVLNQCLLLAPADLAARGERGRFFVKEHLAWEGIAERFLEFYSWLLLQKKDLPPPFVQLSTP